MRFEGKTLDEALEFAAAAVGRPADDLQYRIVEDKKSFWGSRRVIVELLTDGTMKIVPPKIVSPAAARTQPVEDVSEEAVEEVSRILRELLVAAGLRVNVARREGLAFDLSGEDLPHLLLHQGEGLEGLQTLAGRIASRKLDAPVFPQVDAEGFRERRRERLEESARRQAEKVKQSGRKVLLDPMSPADRRIVHLTLSTDSQVETRSEGEGFFKRVGIFPKR
jgi:spoIIIJ-associated protein